MSQAALIRTAIIELMQGSLGNARKLPLQLFGFGVFDGQPMTAQQARAGDSRYQHQFDVTISTARPHRSTPFSTKANYRMEARQVALRVVTNLSATSDELARLEARERVEQACSDAIGALSYPGNLTFTVSGQETRITSGMLCGTEDGAGVPRYELVNEDWKRQLLISRILGVAIVNVPQAVGS